MQAKSAFATAAKLRGEKSLFADIKKDCNELRARRRELSSEYLA